MIHLVLTGHLGGDPELKYLDDGTPVCNFSVACNNPRERTPEGEADPPPMWFRITTWGKLAESCNEYLAKSKHALVTGTYVIRPYKDKEGFEAYSHDVNANQVEFLTPADKQDPRDPKADRTGARRPATEEPGGDGESEAPASGGKRRVAASKPA